MKTQYTIFNLKKKEKKMNLNYPKPAARGFFQRLKNEFERAVVNKPSVFEPLEDYCILYCI